MLSTAGLKANWFPGLNEHAKMLASGIMRSSLECRALESRGHRGMVAVNESALRETMMWLTANRVQS